MTSRFSSRMDRTTPPTIAGQGGGGTTCPPSFTLLDGGYQKADKIIFNPLKLVETFSRGDRFVLNPLKLNETVSRGDVYRIPTISINPPETLQRSDIGIFAVGPLTAQARSGTPDSDDWGDAWTDNTVGQTGTNHGNVDPLAMAVGTAGVGVNLAWVEINLTRYTGLTATGGTHTITGVFTNGSALVASTISLKGAGQASRPFTESTITQSNQPATPAGFTVTANLAAGATNSTLTFTLNDSQMNQLLGKWAVLQFSSSGGTVATPDTLHSREAGSNKMTITFKAQV